MDRRQQPERIKSDIQHNSITNSHEKTEFEHEASVTTDLITLVQRPANSRSSPERVERRLAIQTSRLSNWYPATVPGVVHTDLINNKIIEDPFFRLNERGMQWIDKEDWIYQTSFQLTPEIMERQNIDLVFKGLDTYADVYLNEKKILETNNMFREWKTNIKAELKPGENILKIYFHSPIKVDIPKWDALPLPLRSQ